MWSHQFNFTRFRTLVYSTKFSVRLECYGICNTEQASVNVSVNVNSEFI